MLGAKDDLDCISFRAFDASEVIGAVPVTPSQLSHHLIGPVGSPSNQSSVPLRTALATVK